jgi:hypothetical protein
VAITKSIRFAAPYTSGTFNNEELLNIGRNGVVTGCSVSTSGTVVTVQPGSFIQQGLIVSFSVPLSTVLPSNLVAPYSVVVTTSSSVQNPAEVITPTFAQRPEDLSLNSVVLADWDGQEWVARQHLQINDILLAAQNKDVEQGFTGVAQGFEVTSAAGNLVTTPGSLIDQQGSYFAKTLSQSFPEVASDIDGLLRVDELVYRRPSDDPNRPGSLQYVVGPTFNAASSVEVLHTTEIGNTSVVNTAGKILNVASTNESIFLYIADYGARAQLMLRSSPDLMTSVSSASSITTGLSGFDAAFSLSGNIDLIYTRGNNLYYQQVTTAGAPVVAEIQIASHAVPLANPKLASIVTGTIYYMHIVYEVVLSNAVHQLFYVRLSSSATVETPQQLLVDLSAVVTNPSVANDDTDDVLLLAYENATTGKVYYREYDASTATAVAPPTQLGTTLELEDDTLVISSDTVLPANGAQQPIIKIAENKEVYVFWLQNKGSGNYGVGIYNEAYITDFGHKSVIQDLIVSGENIGLFDVQLDGLSNAHFLLGRGTHTYKASLQLESADVLGATTAIDSTLPSAVATNFNAKGSLVQMWSYPSTGTTPNNSTLPVQFIGPGLFPVSSSVAANEFVMLQSDYNSLPTVPTVGDTLTIASAGSDNGTFQFLSARTYVEASVTYVAVATSATFTMHASGPTVQFLLQAGTDIDVAKTTAGVFTNLRSFSPIHTDVILAHYRTPDGVVAVQSEALDARTDISRLYEFLNVSEASGVVDWQVLGTSILSFVNNITFNFLNRVSTYTVNALPGGITIPPGSAAYVQIPDTDEDATLTLEVAAFGSGILDRNSRNTYVLFWNVGGTLYSKFASMSASNHQNIIYVSLSGSDASGNGSYNNPFRTWVKANDAVLAASPAPSISNIYTIWGDPGFYQETSSFTFLDFCVYYMPVGAVGAGGVCVPDPLHLGQYLNITVNQASGSQIFLYGVSTTSDYTGATGSGIVINDDGTPHDGHYEVFGMSLASIPGPTTFNGLGASRSIIVCDTDTILSNFPGAGTIVNNAQLQLSKAYARNTITLNQTTPPGDGGCVLYGEHAVIADLVTINGGSGDPAYAALLSCDSRVASFAVNGTNASLRADSVSLPSDSSNITYSGGASAASNLILYTEAYALGYSPSVATQWPYSEPNDAHDGLETATDSARALLFPFKTDVNLANTYRVIINPVDVTMLDGTIASRLQKQNIMEFAGAQVDFSNGNIYDITGVTVTQTFTLSAVPTGDWLWYAISLTTETIGTDNRAIAQVSVSPATGYASGADPYVSGAPRATFISGTPVSQVAIQSTGATAGQIEPLTQTNVVQTFAGNGSGSGSSSGVPASPADGFQFLVAENPFSAPAGSPGSDIDPANTTGTFNGGELLYQMLCDKTKTITTVGTAYTLSGDPSFTVTPGCIIWVNSLATWARIATVTTQSTGTLDAAFSSNQSGAAGMVSQAVTTLDLTAIGLASHHQRGIDIFPGETVNQINIAYTDSLAIADGIFDPVVTAEIVVSGSNSGLQGASGTPLSSTYTSIFTRPSEVPVDGQLPTWPNYPLTLNTNSQRLFLVFFPNPNNGSVTAQSNLLSYSASMYPAQVLNNGGYLNSAFCMTDGSGTPVDSSVAVVGGYTQVTLTWSYVPGLNPGLPDGDLEVIIEGAVIPRYFTGVVGQYYTELNPYLIQLSADYSGFSYSVQVRRRQGSIDTADQNALTLGNLAAATVGTSAQVAAGQAGYTTLTSALAAVGAGARIQILPGVTTTEPGGSVTISQAVMLFGNGLSSVIGANLVVGSTTGSSTPTDGSVLKWFKVTGTITLNANYMFYQEAWQTLGQTFTDNGIENTVQIRTL